MSTVESIYREQPFARQLWRFSRPHTIVGTSLSLLALWVLALGLRTDGIHVIRPLDLSITLVACLGANVYIVGLNQLTDVPLDRINKPYLPLASGAFGERTGRYIVGVALAISLAACIALDSAWLYWTVGLSLGLGTAYSLPPFRLKRFHFWAAFCIIAVRSLIVNLLLFAHVASWRRPLTELPPVIWLLTAVMFAFSIAIAWFKDLPDLAGDKAFDVRTLPVRLGPTRVLHYGAAVLGLVVVASIPLAVVWVELPALALVQGLLLVAFLLLVRWVDVYSATRLRRFYLGLWALFFCEYIAFALAGYT